MPVNREPHSIDDHAEEESAVRRAPYEQDDAYELQDHEFTLVAEAEEAAENSGWPYDEHTTPWTSVGAVPPLPAWAAKSRAILEPPTLPRPLNDETPTLVEESTGAISATAVRALREELAESVRESTAQRARIDQLESALAAAGRAADRASFEDDRASSALLGQVQGQAARINELDTSVRKLVTRREELEEALKAAEARSRDAATKIEGLERALKLAEVDARHAALKIDGLEQALKLAEEEAREATAKVVGLEESLTTAALQLREAAAKVEELEARAAVTVEWIENAAPSLEVTIEVDANDDPPLTAAALEPSGPFEQSAVEESSPIEPSAVEESAVDAATIENVPVTGIVPLNPPAPERLSTAETTLEIDPDADLVDADTELPELTVPSPQPAPDEIPTRVLRRPRARDDFQRIDGIGKRLAERLQQSGIRTFAQFAALEKKDLARVAKQVGVTPERIAREGWLKQARKLKSKPAKRAARPRTRASASTPKRKAAEARSRKRA